MSAEVEIYVRCDCAELLGFLASLCSAAPTWRKRQQERLVAHSASLHLGATAEAAVARALVVEGVADGFHSVLLTADVLPWPDDLTLARAAAVALAPTSSRLEVRCNARAWQPGDDEDDGWLAITADGERSLRWRTD